jgi:hypothetical protein
MHKRSLLSEQPSYMTFSISQLVNFSGNFWNVQEFRNTAELRHF